MTNRYHYTESGLDYVWLANGFAIRDTPRGQVVRFHDLDGLHRAIGHFLVTSRRRLDGREIRFLRHELDLSLAALSHLLGVTERTVARWERDEIKPPRTAELAIRTLYQERADGGAKVGEQLQQMAEVEDADNQPLNLVEDHGWSEAA